MQILENKVWIRHYYPIKRKSSDKVNYLLDKPGHSNFAYILKINHSGVFSFITSKISFMPNANWPRKNIWINSLFRLLQTKQAVITKLVPTYWFLSRVGLTSRTRARSYWLDNLNWNVNSFIKAAKNVGSRSLSVDQIIYFTIFEESRCLPNKILSSCSH